MNYSVETVSPNSVKALCALQKEYSREVFKQNITVDEGFYLNFPPLEYGKNVFCVFDSDSRMLGYCMVFKPLIDNESPDNVDYEMWCDLTILPAYQDKQAINNILYEKIIDRAREIQKELPQRRIHLTKGVYPAEKYSIDLFKSKGLIEREVLKTLFVNIRERPVEMVIPKEIEIIRYIPKDIAETMSYLRAHNQIFSENPFDPESLDAHFKSEGWKVGTLICAFTREGDIVAGIKVYTYQGGQGGERTGISDSIFTLPEWRGKGIAKILINESLRFLFENNIKKACLEVSSLNENAFKLYTLMGYNVEYERIIMIKPLL